MREDDGYIYIINCIYLHSFQYLFFYFQNFPTTLKRSQISDFGNIQARFLLSVPNYIPGNAYKKYKSGFYVPA